MSTENKGPKLVPKKSTVAPHVANVEQIDGVGRAKPGTYSVPRRDAIGDGDKSAGSSKHGEHSGRKHPPTQKLGGDDFAAGVSQGPHSTQNTGE